jgi:hypothetical protein
VLHLFAATDDLAERQLLAVACVTPSKLQSDIAGRAGRGWYEVFDRMPFNPWRPQQMGSRPKPNGKYRVIVNASFPHRAEIART